MNQVKAEKKQRDKLIEQMTEELEEATKYKEISEKLQIQIDELKVEIEKIF